LLPDVFINGFSAGTYWPNVLLQLYGIFFTTNFGPFALGFDQDAYSDEVLYRNPNLYSVG